MTQSNKNDNSFDQRLVEYLTQFVTDQRLEKIEQVLEYRTRYLTVVLEDIYQPHNASAVLRSCEIFGVQDIHIIENDNEYEVNPDVVLGASKWLNLFKYNKLENNTAACLSELKEKNYRIIAASPYDNNYLLEDLPLDNKTALVFGTEMRGITDIVTDMADGFVKVPMYGFTESLNISVSAAICLYELTRKLHQSDINWQLTDKEKTDIKLQWLISSVKSSQMLIDRFVKTNRDS